MKKKPSLSRRRFIKETSIVAVGGSFFSAMPAVSGRPAGRSSTPARTRVVMIRNRQVLDENGVIRPEVLRGMLDDAVTSLVGNDSPVRCWRTFIDSRDTVGIKSNVWKFLPTPPELEQAIKQRVMDAGVPEDRIGIKDRGILADPIFMNATALINVRPMRSHHWSGVGSLIKNYIMFVPKPWEYHDDACADLASIWNLPLVKGKTRLNILVMLTPQFHGVGPHSFNPDYVWRYYAIIAGFDPVAVDTVGVSIIQAKRKAFFQDDRPLNPPPKHIFLADSRHHLGTADMSGIDLIKLGYPDDMLI